MTKTKGKTDLKRQLDEAEWAWIKPHLARDAVIVVSARLDILDAGDRIAADDQKMLETWIGQGLLSKPNEAQLREWNAGPSRRFLMLIVAPYVLIQEKAALH